MRCYKCGSTKHFAAKCLQKDNTYVKTQDVHLTLLTANPDERQKVLIGESLGKGVLDSACTKTVSGRTWMEEYISTLLPEVRTQVEEGVSDVVFRFGDGVEVQASAKVKIPVVIGGVKYLLDVDIVENELPLLISKQSMQKMGMKLDFQNDTAIVNGRKIPLICNISMPNQFLER